MHHLQGQLPPRLNTVGRLDVASEGLILLTNDGGCSTVDTTGDTTSSNLLLHASPAACSLAAHAATS